MKQGRLETLALAKDPRLKEIIQALWREYPGLYMEKYKPFAAVVHGVEIDPWLRSFIDPSVEFGQAIGQDHLVYGNKSMALGMGNITRSFLEMALGSYATDVDAANPTEWDELDRLIVAGNGAGEENRDNALELYKSGLIKFFNAIRIAAYDHGEVLPEEGMVQYLQKRLELFFEDAWHPLAFLSDIPVIPESPEIPDDHVTTAFQVSHGFVLGQAVKIDTAGWWILSKASRKEFAGTMGIVCQVVDSDTFKYRHGGVLQALPGTYEEGENYFLSPYLAGELIVQGDPETWEYGNVREYIGTGVPEGLLVEIDTGEVISEGLTIGKSAYHIAIDFGFTGTEMEWLEFLKGEGVPEGGTTGQVLVKNSGADYDCKWVTKPEHKPVSIDESSASRASIDENQKLTIHPPDYSEIQNPPNLRKAFTDLTDVVPDDYLGRKLSVPIVRQEEDMLDLIDTEELVTIEARTTLLADMPPTLAGFAGYSIRVKSDESGFEFYLP